MSRCRFHRRSFFPRLVCDVIASAAVASAATAQMPATRVVVAESQMRELPATAVLVGTVDAVRRSRVGAEVSGLVMRMPARQGDLVEAGDLICKLNDDIVTFRLAEAKGRLESLKARHEELLAGTRQEVLDRLKAQVDEAEAIRKRWAYERERVRRLYSDSDAGSQKEVYDAEAEFLAAEGRHRAAQAAYDEAVKGPRPEVIAGAAYEVAEQEAVVRRLQAELTKTEIRAPFSGYVVNRVVEVGEWVNAGGQVVELADLSTMLVRVFVPESAIPYCQIGDSVSVGVDALQRTLSGRIAHRVPLADPNARTFPVEVELDNADGALAAGMFARATMPAGPTAQSVAVPKDAVIEREGTSFVATVVPGERGGLMGMPMPVTTGADVGGWVAVTSGNVRPGMAVIVRGNERILFPQPVETVDDMGRPVSFTAPAPFTPAGAPRPDQATDGSPRPNQATDGHDPAPPK